MTIDRPFLRFLGVAGLQNLVTYAVYLLVLVVAPWGIAFACAMIVGLAFQTVFQIRATFGAKLTRRLSGHYVLYQLAHTAIFASLLSFAITAGIPEEIAPVLVVFIVTPANFIITRWVIAGNKNKNLKKIEKI
jgi:putative flippase GtrA